MTKRIFTLPLLTLALGTTFFSCKGNSAQRYSINGTTADSALNGEKVYLLDYQLSGNQIIDSAVVTGGSFSLSGEIPRASLLQLQSKDFGYSLLSEEDITIELNHPIKISSGQQNVQMQKFIANANELERDFHSKLEALPQDDTAGREKTFAAHQKTIAQLMDSTMNANMDNMVGVMMFLEQQRFGKLNLTQFDSMASQLPLTEGFVLVEKARARLVSIEATKVGQKFVDLTGETADGKPSRLSDFVGKGKVVLVDFWASWCAPCKQILPEIQAARAKYGDRLEVVSVNIWDDKAGFEKALKEGTMPWNHIYASDSSIASELYGITKIPTIIIFDPTGVIVSREVKDFQASLESLLN